MKKILTAVLSGLLLLSACFGFAACGGVTDGSELQGFDIDLAKAVCAELGVEARFQKISWDAKINELNSKNIDLIWNGMTIKESLKTQVLFSNPYMVNKQVAVVKKENVSKFSDENAIKNSNLIAESGSAGADVIEKKFGKTPVLAKAQSDALMEVASGTSEVAIIDSVMAGFYTSTGDYKDRLAIVEIDVEEEQYGIAARKEDTGVMNKINGALAKLYKSGKVGEIATTYGLTVALEPEFEYTETSDTAGWDYIANKGTIIIGYTLFAPIAYAK